MSLQSRVFTLAGIFLATFALQACKHPLAIVGEGDIVDANNSGHGCTLEQFQAQDKACRENEVSGDYFVNYKAEPRPGWRFVRWQGACSLESDFQHCRIEITAASVSLWDATYPDSEIPPSTAVFEPITGETGYLTDAPVAGVTYTTPTLAGVTGSDGSFHYQEGEQVQFLVGATLLGEVTGKAQVTPFDLAGSAVITGHKVEAALDNEDNPLHTVINIAVLLQSLEHDADPGNGIEIRPAVAALFDELRLDVNQPWQDFRNEQALRNAIARGNRFNRFSTTHGIVHPALALNHLYGVLGFPAPTMAISREESSSEQNNPGEVSRWSYDSGGNVTRREIFEGNGRLSTVENWTYDSLGNISRYESEGFGSQSNEKWYYDELGKPTLYTFDPENDGRVEYAVSWHHDSNGDLVRKEERAEEDAPPDAVRHWQYRYHVDGRLNEVVWREDSEDRGTLSATVRYDYDTAARLVQVEMAGDVSALSLANEPLAIPDIPYLQYTETYTVTFHYNAGGRLTRDVRVGVNTELGRYRESHRYDKNGNVTLTESRLVLFDPQTPDEIQRIEYSYDDAGNRTLQVTDDGGDGRPDTVISWEYDNHGNEVREEWDHGNDGVADDVVVSEYDVHGNPVRIETTSHNEGEADQIEVREYRYLYDTSGKVVRKEVFGEDGSDPQEVITYQYHAGGTVALERRLLSEGGSKEASNWYYDALGNMTLQEHDPGFDGTTVAFQRNEYDGLNNMVRSEFDRNADGVPERFESWQYNGKGSLERYELNCTGLAAEFPPFCGGSLDEPLFSHIVEYVYNSKRLLRTEKWTDFPTDGTPDEVEITEYRPDGRVTRKSRDEDLDGTPEWVLTYRYDADGNLVREIGVRDENEDGTPDSTEKETYDANGNVTRRTYDRNGDGRPDEIATWQYDAEGRNTRYAEDRNGDGAADYITTTEFDAHGNVTREAEDSNGDGSPEHVIVFHREYDANGNQVRWEEDEGDDGRADFIAYLEYDANGNLIRQEQDEDGDGDLEYIETRQYDANNNLVYREQDGEGDGTPNRVWTYRYDAGGNLVFESEADDWDSDGELDNTWSVYYQATGWGHLFDLTGHHSFPY